MLEPNERGKARAAFLSAPMGSLDLEEQLYQEEVKAVKQWWTNPRWRYTKRPFTAEQIVAKRGNLKIDHPSNAQSKKLWNLMETRFKVGNVENIFSALLLIILFRMAMLAALTVH